MQLPYKTEQEQNRLNLLEALRQSKVSASQAVAAYCTDLDYDDAPDCAAWQELSQRNELRRYKLRETIKTLEAIRNIPTDPTPASRCITLPKILNDLPVYKRTIAQSTDWKTNMSNWQALKKWAQTTLTPGTWRLSPCSNTVYFNPPIDTYSI